MGQHLVLGFYRKWFSWEYVGDNTHTHIYRIYIYVCDQNMEERSNKLVVVLVKLHLAIYHCYVSKRGIYHCPIDVYLIYRWDNDNKHS